MSKVTKDEIRIELYPQISNINSSKYKKKYKKEGFNQEKCFKNKFDSQYNRFNDYDSRKYSKDSSTLSTSNEDIIDEKPHHHQIDIIIIFTKEMPLTLKLNIRQNYVNIMKLKDTANMGIIVHMLMELKI